MRTPLEERCGAGCAFPTLWTWTAHFLDEEKKCSRDFCSATGVMLSRSFTLLCLTCFAVAEKPSNVLPPNIIIMLMDDVSYLPVQVPPLLMSTFASQSVLWAFLTCSWMGLFVGYLLWLQGQVFTCALCSTDGLGRPGGVWPGIQRDPQPGRDGCSGNALPQFLHGQPSVFSMWVQWLTQRRNTETSRATEDALVMQSSIYSSSSVIINITLMLQ